MMKRFSEDQESRRAACWNVVDVLDDIVLSDTRKVFESLWPAQRQSGIFCHKICGGVSLSQS
jgi:hypothetical protein